MGLSNRKVKILDYLFQSKNETRLEKIVFTVFDKIIIGILTAAIVLAFQQKNVTHEKKKDALLAINKVSTDSIIQKRNDYVADFESFYILCMDNKYSCQLSSNDQSTASRLINKIYLSLINLRSITNLDNDSAYNDALQKLMKEMNTIAMKLSLGFETKRMNYTTQQLTAALDVLNGYYLTMLTILQGAISEKVKHDFDWIQNNE